MSKVHPDDEKNTIRQLRISNSKSDGMTSWLRHKSDSEAGVIDEMILKGYYTLDMMADELSKRFNSKKKDKKQWEIRIKSHLRHIGQGEHDLKIKISDAGIISFDY